MANIVILGAGVSGHTAALHLARKVGGAHRITVVSPNSQWNWIPSNIWVGVDKMDKADVVFPLAPIYAKKGVEFVQGKAVAIWPRGRGDDLRPTVTVELTGPGRIGSEETIGYDYLVNATGPRLKFEMTPGLGPSANSLSVCTADHAAHAAAALDEVIESLRRGATQTLVVGMGHGSCTCEGAAFEYVFNVDHVLREAGVRDKARLVYLTNEHELGDFGVGGMTFDHKGRELTSEAWMMGLFHEREIEVILAAHVTEVKPHEVTYDTVFGESGSLDFDFAMLLPPFGGAGMSAFDRDGSDITDTMFAPSGFMKVDADYGVDGYDNWAAEDWPSTYESPAFPDHFAVGIAFAPPHAISKPYATPGGAPVAPAPPRTGMPSGVQGKTVAGTIADRLSDPTAPARTASMAKMGAACVASVGTGFRQGAAAAITMTPIVPDHARFPATGRNTAETFGEIGLAGHWMKRLLHTLFIYKAKALPGWWLIPE